jgi:hypothetical protein
VFNKKKYHWKFLKEFYGIKEGYSKNLKKLAHEELYGSPNMVLMQRKLNFMFGFHL